VAVLASSPAAAAAKKPHIVLVLADDYGWANVGYHTTNDQAKAEVHTPNIDALVASGVELDRHYTYKICSPTRSSLQTGRLAVHVNDRNIPVISVNPKDPVSGFSAIPRNMTGIATKLRSGGYRTHMVGKWDAGMATPDHSPKGRGYESFYGYYQHANDYWRKNTPLTATGEVDNCLNRFVDFSEHNETYCGPVTDAYSLSDKCREDPNHDPACYEEHLFKERVLRIVDRHDTSKEDSPLFLFYSFHLLHTPLQVPPFYLAQIDELVKAKGGKPFDSANRRLYAAMAAYMDEAIGEMVKALQAKQMWDDTLLIFTSDNGGPIYSPGSSNNHPLKGGKYSDWEGGIRTNTFVSGGFVPKEKRGAKHEGIVSVADWYGTLCNLAGVDMKDERSEAANGFLKEHGLPLLHQVESVDQWGHILAGTNGRPDAFHVSAQVVMLWPYKLVTGKQEYSAWTGPSYPNCSTMESLSTDHGPTFADFGIFSVHIPLTTNDEDLDRITWAEDCGEAGCLFNIQDDPAEHVNLAGDAAHADTLKSLQAKLADLNKELFLPDRGTGKLEGCMTAIDQAGTYGPFVDVQGYYSPLPEPTPAQRARDDSLRKELQFVNQDIIQRGATEAAKIIMPIIRQQFVNMVGSDVCLSGAGAGAAPRPWTPPKSWYPEAEVLLV